MKHTKDLLGAEIIRLEKSVEKHRRVGETDSETEYLLELIQDYSDSLKILNERNSVDEGEKSFRCIKEHTEDGRCKKYCGGFICDEWK